VSLTTTIVDAAPERVWEVLSDPACYPRWVVGAKGFRGADAEFPAIGSKFHHCVGFGPLTVEDHTEVLDLQPPFRIELKAKARPLGTARVVLLVQQMAENRSYLTLIEDAGDPLTRFVFNPLTNALVWGRNVKALERLKAMIEDGPDAAQAVEARQKRGSPVLK
jgi:uncharacterized protein YndB with AHSA1/START domain